MLEKIEIKEKNNKLKLRVGVSDEINDSYINFLNSLSELKVEITKFSDIVDKDKYKPLDLLLFTGGEDVTPNMYGENKGEHTKNNNKRDLKEEKIFSIYYSTPKLGICRGSQFLTVMAGGKLIQHIEGHNNGYHEIENIEGQYFSMTSTHHQMMFPYNLKNHKYILLAWSKNLKEILI